ncbi:MAG: response regulator [Suipraeoptans sp.]
MYTVIIADDEFELRQSLLENIDWNRLGFEVVGEATNGMEALELVEELEPDLLLTDIKMPFVSGIELAREASRIRPAMNIAFLSGYDDFEYAKEAIQYNIISYLLKPLSGEELSNELLAIREKMDKQVEQIKSLETQMRQEERDEIMKFSFLVDLCMNEEQDIFSKEDNELELEETASQVGLGSLSENTKNFLIFVTRVLDAQGRNITKLEHQTFVSNIVTRYAKNTSAYINGKVISIVSGSLRNLNKYEEVFTKEIIQNSKKYLDANCIIGVSDKFDLLISARKAYLDSITAWDYAKEESDNIFFISDMPKPGAPSPETEICSTEEIRTITLELERRMKTGQGVEEFLEMTIGKIDRQSNSLLILQILTTIYGVVSTLADAKSKDTLMKEFLINEKINVNYSYEDIVSLASSASEVIVGQRRHNTEIICEEMLDIIDNEYMSMELSLSEISKKLHISSGYLSTVIKKNKGATFVSLLTAKRMEVAKEYLLFTAKKVMEISEDCGYSDYHYFSYCFKKYYGISPNKMREETKGV